MDSQTQKDDNFQTIIVQLLSMAEEKGASTLGTVAYNSVADALEPLPESADARYLLEQLLASS